MPGEENKDRDADKDKGLLVYAESHTGESNRKVDGKQNTEQILHKETGIFLKKTKHERAAQNTNKAQYMRKCVYVWA